MADAFTKVSGLLKKLSPHELAAVILLAKGLGAAEPEPSVGASALRMRRHRERHGSSPPLRDPASPDASLQASHVTSHSNGHSPAPPVVRSDEATSKESEISKRIKEDVQTVLNFLHEKRKGFFGENLRGYEAKGAHFRLVSARLREASVQDCKSVIAKKARDWKDKPDMWIYLRPATLFNASKFADYLGEIGAGES